MPTQPANDPLDWFEDWFDEARQSSQPQPTAMSLATVDPSGQPTVRIVLLKDVDRKGFVFYTNLNSAKARHLNAESRVGLCFLWQALGRQVRVEGRACPIDEDRADAYFASRPRASQLGAWASKQSQPLADRATLNERMARMKRRFEGQPVDRPPFWSGYRVVPTAFEFWQIGDHRLHDRWRFEGQAKPWQWQCQRLYP